MTEPVFQHGLEMDPDRGRGWSTGGIITRGVVIDSYFADEETRKGYLDKSGTGQPREIKAVACSVLTYGGRHRFFLPRVPVMQVRHGLNDHSVWIPRPTRKDLSTGIAPILPKGDQPSREKTGDPTNFDGDHVLISFIDNDPQQPIIVGELPHPRAQFRMVKADGEQTRSQFRGTSVAIDKDGNATLDTTGANSGNIDNDGRETPALDALHGKVTVNVNHNARLLVRGVKDATGADEKFSLEMRDNETTVRLGAGQTLTMTGNGAATVAQLGSGDEAVVNFSHLEALWNKMVGFLISHVHPTGMGPSGPPTPTPDSPQLAPMSTFGPNIKSTKLKIPPTP